MAPLLVFSSACAVDVSTGPPSPAAPTLDLAAFELIDMSYGYGEQTLFWPTATQRFELDEVAYGTSEGGYFYSAYDFCAPEHGGTHLDAPRHFAEQGWTSEQIPLERLITPAVVIDVSAAASQDRDYRATADDVESWEAEHGRVPAGATAYLRTGWGSRWPDALSYLGDDVPGDASNLHFPSFGEDAARLLVERGVVALGVDTASIDYGPTADFPVHRLANADNVLGLENVARLGELPPTGAWTIALPMKIEGGSGGPARVVGLVPRAP
jgi:kynurenine formamidase